MKNEPKVSDIMTRDVITLHDWENVNDVAKDLKRFHLRHLPVVSGKSLIGLITHRDFLATTSNVLDSSLGKRSADVRLHERTFVRSIMTQGITTVTPETSVEEAARKMVKTKFGCLPVVNDAGELVGIVTEHDFLKFLLTQLVKRRSQATHTEQESPAKTLGIEGRGL